MKRRLAFTLVELLVVIAIIGVLVAILLPAVQAAREAARRAQCVNNLKQIGLGLHNYLGAHQILPPGGISGPSFQLGSTLVHLLPFIEQQNVFDMYDFRQPNIDTQFIPGTSTEIRTQIISTFLCPSDNHEGTIDGEGSSAGEGTGRLAVHNYAASRGPNGLYNNPSCSCTNGWNAYQMAPFESARIFPGPFTRLGTCVRLKEIRDGLSKTIFFGEVRPGCSWHADNGWGTSNNGNGYCSTVIPINADSCSRNDPAVTDGCAKHCNYNIEAGFKSAHVGGAFFLLGDGAAIFLAETIDHQLYQYLGAKDDGQAVQVP